MHVRGLKLYFYVLEKSQGLKGGVSLGVVRRVGKSRFSRSYQRTWFTNMAGCATFTLREKHRLR